MCCCGWGWGDGGWVGGWAEKWEGEMSGRREGHANFAIKISVGCSYVDLFVPYEEMTI